MNKWMQYAAPMSIAGFDFGGARTTARMNGWINFLLTDWFWTRLYGGYNLRRRSDGRVPTPDDPIVGRADGSIATVSDLAWMNHHAASSRFIYRLTGVGGGGVEDWKSSPTVAEVVIRADGTLATALPNAPLSLVCVPLVDGKFILRWSYKLVGQAVAPTTFFLYHNSGSGNVQYGSSFATVTYAGSGLYEYTTAVLAGASLALWRFAVRAGTSSSTMEQNTMVSESFNRTGEPDAEANPTPVGASHG